MVTVDARPASIDAQFLPGASVALTLVWPEGSLAGRSFTSTLDGDALEVAVVGDVATVEVSADLTAAYGGPRGHARWLLLEDGEPILRGAWTASTTSSVAVRPDTVNVTEGAATVAVTVVSSQASVVALADRVEAVETAEVVHDWATDGWVPFGTRFQINGDTAAGGPQAFALTVEAGRGRFTGTRDLDGSNSGGNARELLLRDGTLWADSEVRSIWWGPSTLGGSPANSPQLGHVHRAQEIEPGVWVAFLAWHNIAFSAFQTVQLNAWQGSGLDGGDAGSLGQATGGSHADASSTERRMAARYVERLTFGETVTQLRCLPTGLYGLANGDLVTLTNQGTLNFASAAAENANRTTGFVQVDSAGANESAAVGGGMLDFAAARRRYFPQVVASRLVGNTLSLKRWRPEDAEPDWGDPTATATVTVTPSATVPALTAGPGLCGLLAAHAHSGSHGEYGAATFRRL